MKKFPSFEKVFDEVNKLFNKFFISGDASCSQKCSLTYGYLKEWYESSLKSEEEETGRSIASMAEEIIAWRKRYNNVSSEITRLTGEGRFKVYEGSVQDVIDDFFSKEDEEGSGE
jgi:hypothetical protein